MKIYRNKKTIGAIFTDAEREAELYLEREIDATLFDSILSFGIDFGSKEIVVVIEYRDQDRDIQTINKPLNDLIKETLKVDHRPAFDDCCPELQKIADALHAAAARIETKIKNCKTGSLKLKNRK